MRPSLAAILFGSTCTKVCENQCWQLVILVSVFSTKQKTPLMYHSLITALLSLLSGIKVRFFFIKRRCLFSRWQPCIFHMIQAGFHRLTYISASSYSFKPVTDTDWGNVQVLHIIKKSIWVKDHVRQLRKQTIKVASVYGTDNFSKLDQHIPNASQ